MRRLNVRFFSVNVLMLLAFFCLLFTPIDAQEVKPSSPVHLILQQKSYEEGKLIPILVQIEISKGAHTYWKNPGESGIAPSFRWNLPKGFSLKELRWPAPKLFERDGVRFFGYEGTVTLIAMVEMTKEVTRGSYPLELEVSWLECNGMCLPKEASSKVTIDIGQKAVFDESPGIYLKAIEALIPLPEESFFIPSDGILSIILDEDMKDITSLRIFPEEEVWTSSSFKASFIQKEKKIEIQLPIPSSLSKQDVKTGQFHAVVILNGHSRTGEIVQKEIAIQKKESLSLDSPQVISSIKEKGVMEEFVGRNIWNLLLIGFVGGLILNVMPCVLPVLGLKVMHHISASKRSYISSLVSACMYTLGILVSFWIIALLLFFLQKADMSYGWGFQLQNPYFVAFLMFVFLLISANLFGLFESGTSIATWAQESEESIKEGQFKHRYLVPFFSGILMMLVSTPCTGPLLGAIIGLSSSLPLVNSLLLYSSIALGVASPFLLAGLIPLPITSWLLPKPGPWMNTVKQFLGFLLLLSSIWLLWALSSLAPEMVYELAILGTFFLFFGAWLYGKSQIHTNSFLGKVSFFFSLLFLLIAMTCTIGSFNPNVRQNLSSFFLGKELEWQPFSFERLQKEVEGGKIVLVDASARWCLTCQSNDFVFTQEELKKYLIEKQVILLRADWTKRNSEITKWLHSMQRNGVPTIALYKQGKEVILLPELITTDIVKNSVNTIVEEKK